MAQRLIQNRGVKGLLILAFWTVVGLSYASQLYLASPKLGISVSWTQAVRWSLADWYLWALLSIPIIYCARRWRFEQRPWSWMALFHLWVGAIFTLGYMLLRAWVGQWQSGLEGQVVGFGETFRSLLGKSLHIFLIYGVIVTVTLAMDYYGKYQERELRASELEMNLARARLQALQMQLNPHFLFNTLQAISTLMHRDVEAADRMISRLSDLLRNVLQGSDDQVVPLEQEIRFLKKYLEIEQTRFGERLAVRLEIDPGAAEAEVPNLLLQPIVENAIRHGIEPHARTGRVTIRAQRQGERLVVEVSDNGAGLKGEPAEGIGLSNSRTRLEHLYGADHRFELGEGPEGGLAVRMEIPLRWRPAPPAAARAGSGERAPAVLG